MGLHEMFISLSLTGFAFLLLTKAAHTRTQPLYKFILSVQNDSPIFCGDQAHVKVVLENDWHHMEYRYQLISGNSEVIQQFYSTSKSEVFIYNTPQTFCKNVIINATVSYQYKPNQWDVIASNQTTIQINDTIHCEISTTQYEPKVDGRTFNIGKVNFSVSVSDSNDYLKKPKYSYDFGDSSILANRTNSSASHVYTKEGGFQVLVHVNAIGKDRKRRKGSCKVKIQIKAILEITISVQQKTDGPRLPSFPEKYSTGHPIYIYINVTDPYEFFKDANITYEYDYHGQSQSSMMNHIAINFTDPGSYIVDTKAVAMKNSKEFVSQKKSTSIDVITPITNIKMRRLRDKGYIKVESQQSYIITCNGSYPLSVCWYISQNKCEMPTNIECSWSFIQHDCQLEFNYTFWKSGRHCAIISVRNQVDTNHLHQIINVDSIEENDKRRVGLVVIIVVVSLCLVLLCFFLIMKHTSKKSKRGRVTEEAKFDFRDQSTSSDSFSLFSWLPWDKLGTIVDHITSFFARCSCNTYNDSEDDSEEECEEGEDQQAFFNKTKRFNAAASRKKRKLRYSLQRKTSYYGTVHMNLAQQHEPIVDGDVFVTSPGGRGNQQQREPEEIGMRQIRR